MCRLAVSRLHEALSWRADKMQVSTAIQNSQVELNFMHSKCGKMGDCIRPVLKGARFEVFSHSRGTGSDIVAYKSNKK